MRVPCHCHAGTVNATYRQHLHSKKGCMNTLCQVLQAVSAAAPDCTVGSRFQSIWRRTQCGGPRCAQQNKACLTTRLAFKLYTVTLIRPLLVTATRVPEAFQLAFQEADALPSSSSPCIEGTH